MVKVSQLDSFSILTRFLSNCYAAENHFFLVMPHDHPQHFVCKNTHDLLDIDLTRYGPLLGSLFASPDLLPLTFPPNQSVRSMYVGEIALGIFGFDDEISGEV